MALARGVYAILQRHWDIVEGDWSIHHHRDLVADCFGPAEIGVRRLYVYLQALPEGCRTWRALRAEPWTNSDEMGATTVELLADISQSLRVQINQSIPKGKPAYKPAMPFQWERPGVKVEPETQPLTRAGVRAAFLGP